VDSLIVNEVNQNEFNFDSNLSYFTHVQGFKRWRHEQLESIGNAKVLIAIGRAVMRAGLWFLLLMAHSFD